MWNVVHAERRALAADLAGLDDDRWATPSICSGWTVRDVLAHMTATAKNTPPAFVGQMITSGFRLTTLQEKGIAAERGDSPSETLERFRAVQSSTRHPPGPVDSWLGETIVHAEDIRRPLAITHAYPTDAAIRVANFYRRSNLIIGAKRRVAGLALRATDADWSAGTGPEVAGPIVAVVLAMTGRKAVLGELSGDGVSTLAQRP